VLGGRVLIYLDTYLLELRLLLLKLLLFQQLLLELLDVAAALFDFSFGLQNQSLVVKGVLVFVSHLEFLFLQAYI
jgi:hypothetical protein